MKTVSAIIHLELTGEVVDMLEQHAKEHNFESPSDSLSYIVSKALNKFTDEYIKKKKGFLTEEEAKAENLSMLNLAISDLNSALDAFTHLELTDNTFELMAEIDDVIGYIERIKKDAQRL